MFLRILALRLEQEKSLLICFIIYLLNLFLVACGKTFELQGQHSQFSILLKYSLLTLFWKKFVQAQACRELFSLIWGKHGFNLRTFNLVLGIVNYVPLTTKAFIQSTDALLESSGIKYN